MKADKKPKEESALAGTPCCGKNGTVGQQVALGLVPFVVVVRRACILCSGLGRSPGRFGTLLDHACIGGCRG